MVELSDVVWWLAYFGHLFLFAGHPAFPLCNFLKPSVWASEAAAMYPLPHTHPEPEIALGTLTERSRGT